MRDYVLMTDSCCDLTDSMARELELEVLLYVQAFTEVCSNRGFDNRTIRLSHQTTHTS